MEIKKYYKSSNEVTDISGDYVEIRMSTSTYFRMKEAIIAAEIHDSMKKWKPLENAFDEALETGDTVWY